MEFTIMWGETPTTMTRIAEKATGYTYYDTYQIVGGPAFGMHRDHFDVRRMRGAPVFAVEGKLRGSGQPRSLSPAGPRGSPGKRVRPGVSITMDPLHVAPAAYKVRAVACAVATALHAMAAPLAFQQPTWAIFLGAWAVGLVASLCSIVSPRNSQSPGERR